MPSFGSTFDPSADQGLTGGDPTNPKRAPQAVQRAIQYLSLRLPRVVGARAPVMPALLGGAGGPSPGASPHVDAIVNSVLGKVLGPSAVSAPAVPPISAPSAAPSPGFGSVPSAAPSAAPLRAQGFGSAPSAPPPVAAAGPRTASSPTPFPTFGFSEAAQEPPPSQPYGDDMRVYRVPEPPPTPAPAPSTPYGDDMRVYRVPEPRPIQMPQVNPNQGLIDEATRRVGAGSDWNQYNTQAFYDNDPFVKLFADTFGRGANWNSLRPGG